MSTDMFSTFSGALLREVSRAFTGRLFTDEQIRSVTSTAIGRYFTDFLPEPADERAARERVEEAKIHIGKASSIVVQLQAELAQQSTQLDSLMAEIDEKKKLADRYAQLAATNQEQFAAMRAEIEEVLRKELVAQSEKGRRIRQVASFVVWAVTLILGAWLGTYFKEIMTWARELFV